MSGHKEHYLLVFSKISIFRNESRIYREGPVRFLLICYSWGQDSSATMISLLSFAKTKGYKWEMNKCNFFNSRIF